MLKIKLEVEHVSLEVKNFTKAMRFYKALFKAAGFKKLTAGEGWAKYANGRFSLLIGEFNKPLKTDNMSAGEEPVNQSDYISFSLGDSREVDRISGALIKAGFEPVFPPRDCRVSGPGFYTATFCDPSSNVLEFSNRKRTTDSGALPAGSNLES